MTESQQPMTITRELRAKIDRLRVADRRDRLVTAAVTGLAGVAALLLVVGLLELLLRFGTTGRMILAALSVVGSLAILFRQTGRPVAEQLGLRASPSDLHLAARIGDRIPTIGDRLANTLELDRLIAPGEADRRQSGAVSLELAAASIVHQGPSLLQHDYLVVIDEQRRRRGLLFLLAALLLTIAGLTLPGEQGLVGAWQRVADFSSHYSRPAPFTLTISPGDVEQDRGTSLVVQVDVDGLLPDRLDLVVEERKSGRRSRLRMEQIGERRFAATTSRLEEPVRYFVEGAGLQSRTYTVSLVDPLFVSSMQVRLVPPAYTGAPAEDLPPGIGTITALRGTTAGISARSSLPVERATIVVQPRGADMATSPFAGSSLLAVVIPGPGRLRIPMQVRDDGKGGSLLDGMIPLRRSGSYHIEVVGRDGRRNVAPTEWGIVVLADGPPRIRLLQPRDTFDVDDSYLVPLQVAVDDDYGFSSLRIRYRLVASDRSDPWQAPRFLRYPLPRYLGTGGTIPYLWRLPSEPGDLYHVTIEAFDNDRSFGAKSARTATLVLRYPGGRQLREKARRDIGEVDAAVARLIEEADRTQRRMERLDRKLAAALASGSSGSDAETQQEIDNLVADHEAAERRLERIADDLATMTERRRQASSIAPETLRRYRELVRLFEQLDDASLRKRVAEIGRKIEELDAEELRAAMRDYSFDEEAFRRSLEASRTMLERLAAKSQLDDLVDEARTLAAEQEEIAREERSRFLADPRQDELAERTAEFQQEVAAATRSIAEQDPFGETASEQIAELAEDLAADNPAAAMKRGEASQKIADDLRSFADELAAMRQSIDRQQRERGAAAMEEAIADITDLAERQRALMERTKKEGSGPIDEEQRGPLARSQQELQRDLVDALDRITAADHPSTTAAPDAASSLAEAVDAMEEATRSIVGGRGQQAVGDQGRAVAALEGAAGTLGEGSKGMGEGTDGEGGSGSDGEGNGAGGSDGSLRSRLQQLAAQQQMLNMAMGEGDGEGGGQMLGENGRPVPSGSSESDGPSADGGTTPDASAAGGNGSADQAGSAKRMIEQQQRLARSLRELERDASGMVDGGDRTTDALAEATAEVDALLRQIGSGRVDDAARRRQDKILSRMLDALDATYERDRNEQRRATVGRDRPRSSPADIPPGLIPQSDAEAMPIEERLRGYSPEYHRLVRQFLLNLGDEGR